ncbi:MAG: RNA methyltransferase [Clostridia bacterium]|nr:RNA methyltransferase [Clostridia bacterium]
MITSKQNSLIKEIRSLSDKKFRDKLNLYVVEGKKLVCEAVELKLPVYVVIGTEKALAELSFDGVRVETVTEEVLSSVSAEVTPQGVMAVIRKPENDLVKPEKSCILLDGVSDPANVGAIIRTAAASGYNTVYTTDDCADPFSQKAVRSSMSGVFRVKIVRASREKLLSIIDKPFIVADMDGESIYQTKVNGDFCLVIGNEGHGVSDLFREKATKVVSIPMANGVESLNASVSAGLLMYGLKNQSEI